MLQKLNDLQFKTYFAYKRFVQGFKDDERGLSGVVVAVMLILVAILAVALLWTLLGNQIETWWKDLIEGAPGENIKPK